MATPTDSQSYARRKSPLQRRGDVLRKRYWLGLRTGFGCRPSRWLTPLSEVINNEKSTTLVTLAP
jgi:hypothetical protein